MIQFDWKTQNLIASSFTDPSHSKMSCGVSFNVPGTVAWFEVELGDCLTQVVDNRGKTPPLEEHGEYELLEVNSVVGHSKHIDYSAAKKRVSAQTYNTWFRKGHPKCGDVLFATVGSIAEVAYVNVQRGCIAQNLIALRPNQSIIDGEFLYYLLTGKAMKAKLLSLNISSVQPSIKVPHLLKSQIKIPEVSQQKRIAHILGTLDDKIELNRRMNAMLESMARALFKSWFVDFDPVHAKQQGRQPAYMDPATAALFPSEFEDSELGPIPKGWEVRSLDQIAAFLNGLALQKFPVKIGKSLPVIKIAQLRKGNTMGADECSADIPEQYIVQNGDVLFSWSGSLLVDLWCGGKGALNQHLFKVTSTQFPKWFYYLWTQHHLQDFRTTAASKATTMGHIQRHHLTAAKTIVPPMELLSALSNTTAPIIDLLLQNSANSRTLSALRDLLLPELVGGQLQEAISIN